MEPFLPYELLSKVLRSNVDTRNYSQLSKKIMHLVNYQHQFIQLNWKKLPTACKYFLHLSLTLIVMPALVQVILFLFSNERRINTRRRCIMETGNKSGMGFKTVDGNEQLIFDPKIYSEENAKYTCSEIESAYFKAVYRRLKRKDVLVSLKMIKHIYERRLKKHSISSSHSYSAFRSWYPICLHLPTCK